MNKKNVTSKVAIICVIVITLLIMPLKNFAHSGRTDSSGGHKDKNNVSGLGSYHYHCGGNPPHLHEGGVCPYSSTTTSTTSSSSTSSTTSSSKSSTSSTSTSTNKSTTPTIVYAESIEMNLEDFEILIGESRNISATISPSNTTNQTITWTSSNDDICPIDSDGNIVAKSVGTVVITAQTSNSKTASINVTVKPIEVTEVKISSENIQLEEGETTNISANVFPENATDKTVEWSVENPEVATIEDGIITAVSSGTTKLFCISKDGVKAETTITVKSDEKEVEDIVTEKEETDNNTSNQVQNTNTPLANAAVGISFLEIILLIICGIKLRSKEEKFPIKKFIGNVVSWMLTIFALIFAIVSTSVISLILALATSISIAPPICKLLNSKLEGKYTVKIRIITYFVLLIISLILI